MTQIIGPVKPLLFPLPVAKFLILYAAWKRLLMIAFVGLAGGDTDTSRDYEYTDWDAVHRFADGFAVSV